MPQTFNTTIGLSANATSSGQAVDFDGAVGRAVVITNNSGVAIQYANGGAAWVTVASGSAATVGEATADTFRLRKSTSDSYPVAVDLAWTAYSEWEAYRWQQGVANLQGVALMGDSMTAGCHQATVISAASRSGNVVTVTATAHNLGSGQPVNIANMLPSSFNAQGVTVTRVDANTFTYPLVGADGAASNLAAGKPMLAVNCQRQMDSGYLWWLQAKSGGAFRVAVNAGANGQTSADMASRFAQDALTYGAARYVFILTGYNDFVGEGLTADAVCANVKSMVDAAANAGKIAVVISALPWTTGGTNTNRGEAARYNRMIRTYCGCRLNARFVDAAAYLVDATGATRFTPLSGMLKSDGIHPSPKGHERIAQAIWDALSAQVPVAKRLVSSNADNLGFDSSSTNLFDNGPWTNSGGNVTAAATGVSATGFNVSMSATGTCVASAPARSDAIGYDQQIVFTPSANNDYAMIGLNANIARVTAGDKLQLLAEVVLSGVSGSNLRGINAYLTFNGAAIACYAVQSTANTASEYPQSDMTLTVASPEITVPTGTTSWNFTVQPLFGAAGTAMTAKLGRISVEKV